ncbi:hypothetical protein BME96_17895 [Virgibacillus halodenitrificans]|uniref:Uncharacterized protein n=1 Tax=Virgibacillus halodenitrificans TaxID=1482 RepID=A0AAC9NLW8_VIRHA|nr:hypothetical protein [Virgibacillus halodenitrificans]APC49957.1 hypothetical protein BME96_17895 [Virgibacillus halodenitrificans]MBD1222523.1 hypothetical protein [Virgibacillus halodenitrificans]MCJ0932111.1 hypothetical protein [Virgibacillus halodenitrificans]MYL59026.1 hypothetical protein [Virgibacillus halodenitrificans]CDQ31767.1 hypothetical protein BN993_01151 [Virgibacillus halodenitrificans]
MGSSVRISEADLERYYILSKQKKEIEQEMKQLKKDFNLNLDDSIGKDQKGEVTCGSYKLQRQVRTAVGYNQELTVQKLEQLNLHDFIIVEKLPDTEKLEAAIKIGLVEETAFTPCKTNKTTTAIVVKEAP